MTFSPFKCFKRYFLSCLLFVIGYMANAQLQKENGSTQEILLIGDTGYSPAYGKSIGLQALQQYIQAKRYKRYAFGFLR